MEEIALINDLVNEIEMLKKIRNHSSDKTNKIDNIIKEKEMLLESCKNNLNSLSNNKIEYKLYLKILDGKTASQAVSEVANENYINDIRPSAVSSIWKYYKKLKKILKRE